MTPLHFAAMRGNTEALEQLIKYPVLDVEAGFDDEGGVSPLHMAATYGHSNSVQWVLSP